MHEKTGKKTFVLVLALALAVIAVSVPLAVIMRGTLLTDMRFEVLDGCVGSRFLESEMTSLFAIWPCGDVYVLGYGGEATAVLEMPHAEKSGTPSLDVTDLDTEALEGKLRNTAYQGDSAMHCGWQTEEKKLWCIYPCSSRIGFNVFADIGKKDLYVLVPEKTKMYLKISAENVYLDSVSATTVALYVSDGDCVIDGLKTQNLTVTANTADIEIYGSEISALDVASYTGNVTLRNCRVTTRVKSKLMFSGFDANACEIAEFSGESFFGGLTFDGDCTVEKLYFESLTGNLVSGTELPDDAEITLNLGKLKVD